MWINGRYKEENPFGLGLVVPLVDNSLYLPAKPQPFTQILDHATFEFLILVPLSIQVGFATCVASIILLLLF